MVGANRSEHDTRFEQSRTPPHLYDDLLLFGGANGALRLSLVIIVIVLIVVVHGGYSRSQNTGLLDLKRQRNVMSAVCLRSNTLSQITPAG